MDNDKIPEITFPPQVYAKLTWLEDHHEDGRAPTWEDALDALAEECGRQADGSCVLAGSEECDECMFQDKGEG